MTHRTVSWTRIDRAGLDARTKIPAGLLGARALVQLGARTRPLVVAGRYDRAAIMAAACKAAGDVAERHLGGRHDAPRPAGAGVMSLASASETYASAFTCIIVRSRYADQDA